MRCILSLSAGHTRACCFFVLWCPTLQNYAVAGCAGLFAGFEKTPISCGAAGCSYETTCRLLTLEIAILAIKNSHFSAQAAIFYCTPLKMHRVCPLGYANVRKMSLTQRICGAEFRRANFFQSLNSKKITYIFSGASNPKSPIQSASTVSVAESSAIQPFCFSRSSSPIIFVSW